MRNPDPVAPPARVHTTAFGRLVPIWCGVVLLAVAMTAVSAPGLLLAMLWAVTWIVSAAGLGLIVLADEETADGRGRHRRHDVGARHATRA